jgi:hypothetical protein
LSRAEGAQKRRARDSGKAFRLSASPSTRSRAQRVLSGRELTSLTPSPDLGCHLLPINHL